MRNMRIEFGDDREAVIKELERLGTRNHLTMVAHTTQKIRSAISS